ncbi:tumor necrosis factor receptor superfamily member 9a [Toxotes jaculatrix]|uniref:tumor necrosis factor receptor superfamily member 9a n=1 Tax=Toxotes jaculatrix TaxID=941984 RepID=UPI001B3AF978|nr:tumor necrosis factor receptor superfamily member 9a [Toxotes jaculatrix]
MAVILWVMGLSMLMQSCLCSVGQPDRGCLIWTPKGDDVCCEECSPGHRLVRKCGPSPKDLCTPCEHGKFTVDPQSYRCSSCTQCVGAQVFLQECTATSDTKCGCKEGLTCGDTRCSFCVMKCGKGQEPTKDRSCRPCPDGTFNDQIHQRCKPWNTKCPDQQIMVKGNAFTDSTCHNVSVYPSHNPKKTDETEKAWVLGISVIISAILTVIIIIILTTVARKNLQKSKETEYGNKKTPPLIIRPPTDEPTTLMTTAIECSFHEAQQEQGSSSESLDSKDSSDQLLA